MANTPGSVSAPTTQYPSVLPQISSISCYPDSFQIKPCSENDQQQPITAAANFSKDLEKPQISMKAKERNEFVAPQNAPSLRILPRWLKYDQQVLRFFGYITNKIEDYHEENTYIRYLVLYFYLDNGTIKINEPKINNSGIVQGLYLKRHAVQHAELPRKIQIEDFKLGKEVNVYGQAIHLVDCDKFTRLFCKSEGLDIGEPTKIEWDPHVKKLINSRKSQSEAFLLDDFLDWKEHRNVANGGARKNAGLKQFLEHDRKILRFFGIWKNDNSDGRTCCTLLYFLADDTMEVVQTRTHGKLYSGEKIFLRKQRPSSTCVACACPGLLLDNPVKYIRQYYQEFLGREQANAIRVTEPHVQKIASTVAATAYIATSKHAPLLESNAALVFYARLHDATEDDKNRQFKMFVREANNGIFVREQKRKNSGRIEGTFAAESRKRNPETGGFYSSKDFFVGAIITIYSVPFEITGAESSTIQASGRHSIHIDEVKQLSGSSANCIKNITENDIAVLKSLYPTITRVESPEEINLDKLLGCIES
ncbi:EF hand family protein [Cardiosporidium cionae]|uniref:EF hand family protein n=1 Tax=Cardiosporidium cionae TaxID=476202 RepID=A0ABQ7J9G2_9APIC|nr:EF hand family protein [Cardiosporidium cionae]|eukprot:KAF8820574.1 EF hand family protein [Cardiosporidium cionae]